MGEAPPRRRYDKGERRNKHVGRSSEPELASIEGTPRHVIGRCPNDIADEEKLRLLNQAIPLNDPDRNAPSAKRLYAVYRGAIYEAQTSDHGWSYHAYPYKGKLSSSILNDLRRMAVEEGSLRSFDKWVRENITRHGT